MALPFFYTEHYQAGNRLIELEEGTSKHMVQVLRMQVGALLNVTDGKGMMLQCKVSVSNKRHCTVEILEIQKTDPPLPKIAIGISLLKNSSRFEWFLEKATEIGATEIIPLLCERTENKKFRMERMQSICVSALLQSQQCHLPQLQSPQQFEHVVKEERPQYQKFIAHCCDTKKQNLTKELLSVNFNQMILIGPEGDFTNSEIALAETNNFISVGLGNQRLRTETAGIVAASLLCC